MLPIPGDVCQLYDTIVYAINAGARIDRVPNEDWQTKSHSEHVRVSGLHRPAGSRDDHHERRRMGRKVRIGSSSQAAEPLKPE